MCVVSVEFNQLNRIQNRYVPGTATATVELQLSKEHILSIDFILFFNPTSMAAPSVTAAAAVIYQYLRDNHYHCTV